MDGLIEQAKTQLWNMVNTMSKVKCENGLPKIEIALYEYGRNTNEKKEGYIQQLSDFTNDLDRLFIQLHELTTKGGDEFCGFVLNTSLDQLNWDSSAASYKVIFIAGNESFLQGPVTVADACKKARTKGVIINTIYCGTREQGIELNWNMGPACGSGSFAAIDQNAVEMRISTPYDSSLISLKDALNKTYIPYGKMGQEHYNSMMRADTIANSDLKDVSKLSNYIVVKSNANIVSNPQWDLIDAYKKDSSIIQTVDMQTLPERLKGKNRSELKKITKATAAERISIQAKIKSLKQKQDSFISAEKARNNDTAVTETLETAIERIIREQVKRFKMTLE
jgi:hypothetical protein